jgi:hypothetical protein
VVIFFLFTVVTFAQKSEFSQTKPDIIILPESTDIHSLTSRKFTGIHQLSSGNLLLVKHGPIDIETKRSHLMAFISKDDGKTWSRGLLLDQRKGISYPDGQQIKDGTINIVYNYNRRTDQNILVISFSEENILSDECDKEIIKVFNNRKTISKGGNEF